MTNTLRLLCLLTFGAGLGLAHEVLTHQNIGTVAVEYLQQSPQYQNRPVLSNLQTRLLVGAVKEDDFFPGSSVFGRFYFHFYPQLASALGSGSCDSIEWGLEDSQCIASNPFAKNPGPQINLFRWDQDLSADPSTGVPTLSSTEGFGYVAHLLEDLGSPPHVRNESHPCPYDNTGLSILSALTTCDAFEVDNNGRTPSLSIALNLPTGSTAVVPTTDFRTPEQFFTALQSFVSANYYSTSTVFAPGMPGPGAVTLFPQSLADLAADATYFYGSCTTGASGFNLSNAAGTCQTVAGRPVRKLAHKGFHYWSFCSVGLCDPTKAEVNATVAQEQFDELGPVIAQHLAAFIQFYAPAITVQVQGGGTVTSSPGTGIDCSSGTCSALFVNGATIQLTAQPPVGLTVQWQGDCSGANPTITLFNLTSDITCTAVFAEPQTVIGTIQSISCVFVPSFLVDEVTVKGTLQGPPGISFNISAAFAGGGEFQSCSPWTAEFGGPSNGDCVNMTGVYGTANFTAVFAEVLRGVTETVTLDGYLPPTSFNQQKASVTCP